MPPTDLDARNYFENETGIEKCRARFVSETKKGRMIGGHGWTKKTVEAFLGRPFTEFHVEQYQKTMTRLGELFTTIVFHQPPKGR